MMLQHHLFIDYIDYGCQVNSFLLSIGVVSYLSAENLADLLIEHQSSYFIQAKNLSNHLISVKLHVYTNCSKQLVALSNVAREF
ncbi:unnamed protein product [Rotaria sp. Silwood1]|nr:unnamed protein product [Rotaria sp. Silwood1]CAF3512472.1 unnamed protein product [Rotaria sp. Silwood1]CAF4978442.1 unnamed protein product [Rotaria sp. Silwood1]